MLHLKQTLHNIYTEILLIILNSQERFEASWSCPRNLVLAENPGRLLHCPMLLVSIAVLTPKDPHPKFVAFLTDNDLRSYKSC